MFNVFTSKRDDRSWQFGSFPSLDSTWYSIAPPVFLLGSCYLVLGFWVILSSFLVMMIMSMDHRVSEKGIFYLVPE